VYPNLVQFVLSCNIISLLRFHCPLAAICYDSGGPIPSLPGLFGMVQDHYGPTRDPFHIGMWHLAHVKAYMGPILYSGTSNYCLPLVVKGFSRVELVFPTVNSHSKISKSIQITKWH